jgi:hypothetical protein
MENQVKLILSNENLFLEVAKAAFDSVDSDGSGQIDSKELELAMAQIAGDMGAEAPSKDDVKEVLEHLDSDKSGKISFDEFRVLIRDVLECMLEAEEEKEKEKEREDSTIKKPQQASCSKKPQQASSESKQSKSHK